MTEEPTGISGRVGKGNKIIGNDVRGYSRGIDVGESEDTEISDNKVVLPNLRVNVGDINAPVGSIGAGPRPRVNYGTW